MLTCLLVGAGGFLGAVCRYLMGLLPWPEGFPWGTLVVNLLGAVLIGLIAYGAMGERENGIAFFQIGLCGGFTTFSSFSLETFRFLDEGKILAAALYISASVLLCLLGVWLGRTMVRGL